MEITWKLGQSLKLIMLTPREKFWCCRSVQQNPHGMHLGNKFWRSCSKISCFISFFAAWELAIELWSYNWYIFILRDWICRLQESWILFGVQELLATRSMKDLHLGMTSGTPKAQACPLEQSAINELLMLIHWNHGLKSGYKFNPQDFFVIVLF